VCATEQLLKEQWCFSFLPPSFGLVITIHYPYTEFGNLSCLEGYIDTPLGCKILENFMYYFFLGECVLVVQKIMLPSLGLVYIFGTNNEDVCLK